MSEWKNTVPRIDLCDLKHASIVILRPHHNGRAWEAGVGQVEMKHGWSVWTSFENHPRIGDEAWESSWLWTLAPVMPGG